MHISIRQSIRNVTLATLLLVLSLVSFADEKTDGWTTTGELAYSFAYARNYLGHKLRLKGWECSLGVTAGKGRNIEISVWERDGKKLQLMIWRIDSGRTGYSWG